MSTVQEIMLRSTDFLWRIFAPVGGQGGVTCLTDSNIGAVVGSEEGAIESNPGNEGGIAQADLSDREPEPCAHVRVVPDVTDVPVSPSSVVTELCEVSWCCSNWEDVIPQSFSFSKKPHFVVQVRKKR